MADCLFCKIVSGDVPATIVREDDSTVAFLDLNAQAPTHILVIPKKHLADLTELGGDPETAAALLAGIRGVVIERALSGYRTVFNTGAGAGQSVYHVHAHVLAGRPLGWPPG